LSETADLLVANDRERVVLDVVELVELLSGFDCFIPGFDWLISGFDWLIYGFDWLIYGFEWLISWIVPARRP